MEENFRNVWDQCNYIAYTGSHAFGCASSDSDHDYYGFFIPETRWLIPWTESCIRGFDKPRDDSKEQVCFKGSVNGIETDAQLYMLPKFVRLAAAGSFTFVDALFSDNIVKCDSIGKILRDNRNMFLSANLAKKLLAAAMSILTDGEAAIVPELISKCYYTSVRMVNQAKYLATTGNYKIFDKDWAEDYKKIRNMGHEIKEWRLGMSASLRAEIEATYGIVEINNAQLNRTCDVAAMRGLLRSCLKDSF